MTALYSFWASVLASLEYTSNGFWVWQRFVSRTTISQTLPFCGLEWHSSCKIGLYGPDLSLPSNAISHPNLTLLWVDA